MQKKLLTLAVASALAVPAVAFAQVTVYGTIDTGIRNQSKINTATGTDSQLQVTEGTRTTNRWGLKGSEDLGGGLMANFTLEGQYASDTGAGPGSGPAGGNNQGLFQRKSIVGLSKGGMSVDLGRDYTVNFKTQGVYDPMSYTYTGITPTAGTNVAGTRSSNMVTAGFRFGTGGVRVDYAAGETVGDNGLGTRIGFNGDFAFGPVTVVAAFSTLESTATVDVTTTNIGAVYNLGAFTIRGGWSDTETDGAAGGNTPLFTIGLQYGFSPTLNGRVGYYNVTAEDAAGTELGKAKTFIVALDYYMSKRTTAYVVFDRKTLSGSFNTGAVGTLADGATGLGVGIAHSF